MSADEWGAYAQVIIVSAGLAALVAVAFLAPVLVRVFLLAQVVYWSLSFVVRPVVLLVALPGPRFADSIADPRLAYTGYGYSIREVLQPIAVAIWLYLLVVLVAVALLRRFSTPSTRRTDRVTASVTTGPSTDLLTTFGVAYVIGTAARAASYISGSAGQAGDVSSANPYLDLVGNFAGLSALGLIAFYRCRRPEGTVAVIVVLLAGELVWGILTESKTPLLGAALAVAIRFALEGYTRRQFLVTAVGGVVLLGAFSWLQSFKVSDATELAFSAADSGYPAVVRPFLSLIRRFDLLEASTDVWYMNSRSWISPVFVAKNLVLNLIPSQLGVQKFQSGTQWAQTVRGSSVDMRGISVSLAEGHLNEGLLIGGYPGVIAESVFVIVMIILTARCLRSNTMLLLVPALGFVAFPSLFERGALGISETLGKVIQLAIALFVLNIVVAWFRRRARRTPASPHLDPTISVPTPVGGSS